MQTRGNTAYPKQFEARNGYLYLYTDGMLEDKGIKKDTDQMRKWVEEHGYKEREPDAKA